MKKLVALIFVVPGSLSALAQTPADAKQLIYYQRYESAANQLHKGLAANPNDPESWYWLSQAYIGADKIAAGQDTLQQAPATVKNTPAFQSAIGHLLLRNNKPDSASYYFRLALESTKEKDATILAAVARAHVDAKTGDVTFALGLLDKAMKREKKDASLSALQGDAYRKTGDGTLAYKAYEAALEKDKKYAAALFQLGKIFVAQKNEEVYVPYFEQALSADPGYAPAYYELYYHYYYKDINRSMDYFQKYMANSDPNVQNESTLTDLLYVSRQYQPAIDKARQLIREGAGSTQPRLYKLMAYSFLGLNDTAKCMQNMQEYFHRAPDTSYTVGDFELMGDLYAREKGKEDSAVYCFAQALARQNDTTAHFTYYRKLADLSKTLQDYGDQAKWLGKYYTNNDKATNLDLFNWGLAHYRAEEFSLADTVFGIYTAKYPDQGFGYYWRAKSNALLDSLMENGTAIPHYNKLIEVLEKDTTNAVNKKWLVEAYGYVAAYETNKEKDYTEAIQYLDKVLVLDPANKDALRYKAILEKNVANPSDNRADTQTNR